ncbi:MAG: rhomboid family intramembrane serine protease [Paludibacter sp.]|nr:rhomboid family intramembrane serine protease [Paludibacter sp.]
MNILDNLKIAFNQGNTVIRLIYINVGIYLIYNVINIIFTLFNLHVDISPYLSVPAEVNKLLLKPWTIITYMFMHAGLTHILFNMIALYWFGKLFLLFFSEKQMVGLYITGGLVSALVYIVAFNLFPFFKPELNQTVLMGASGSIMTIIAAAAIQSPNMQMRLMFLGNIKLKYIALAAVLISFFGITSKNAGGELAHLGGALYGYLFVVSLRLGTDITKWISGVVDFFTDLFSRPKLKTKPNNKNGYRKMSDTEYNANKAQKMSDIDKILDKIKTSGYESLSADEKSRLFNQGRK